MERVRRMKKTNQISGKIVKKSLVEPCWRITENIG